MTSTATTSLKWKRAIAPDAYIARDQDATYIVAGGQGRWDVTVRRNITVGTLTTSDPSPAGIIDRVVGIPTLRVAKLFAEFYSVDADRNHPRHHARNRVTRTLMDAYSTDAARIS